MKITTIEQLNKLGSGTIIYRVIPSEAILNHLVFLFEHPIWKGHAVFSRGRELSNDLYLMSDRVLRANLQELYSDSIEACTIYKKSLKRKYDIFSKSYPDISS